MALRHLTYLRAVLFLTLLLGVLNSPALRFGLMISVAILMMYAAAHILLSYFVYQEVIPPDWSLFASLLDVVLIAVMIYATTGVQINLFVAFFVVVISSLVMESLVFGFLIAGVACAFYGLTVLMAPGALAKPENVIPLALLIVSSFYITFLSSLIRSKRKAMVAEGEQRAIWKERITTSRRVLGEVNAHLQNPLDRVLKAAEGIPEEKKSSISWEIEGIRGQLKRMENVLDVDRARSPIELDTPMERALFKLAETIQKGDFDVEVADFPLALVNGSREQLAELFRSVLLGVMEKLPAKGKVSVASAVRPAQWWERSEKIHGWLSVSAAGSGWKEGADHKAAEDELQAAEWILVSHGGRFDERPEPGEPAPLYRLSLPICAFPSRRKAKHKEVLKA